MELDYEVFDEHYQGPLEGLLEVARSHDVPISEIKLARLVEDFMNYLENSSAWSVGEASSILLLFSELLRIKTRDLLPGSEEEPAKEEEDELPDEKREFFLQVGETLREKAKERARLYDTRPDLPEFVSSGETVYKEVTLFELIKAFQNIVVTQRDQREMPHLKFSDDYDTEEQMESIKSRVQPGNPVAFEELLSSSPVREEIVVTFVALLQLVKQAELRIVKQVDTEEIFVVAPGKANAG